MSLAWLADIKMQIAFDQTRKKQIKRVIDRTLITTTLFCVLSWFVVWPEDRLWVEIGYNALLWGGVPCFLLASVYDRIWPIVDNISRRWLWIETVLVGIITTILFVGNIVFLANWVNAIGQHPLEILQKEILLKRSHLGRPHPTYGVVVLINGARSEIPVSADFYQQARIGDTVLAQMRRGNLGYYYNALWN